MPTPDVNAVLRSQEYYRLKQAVQSPGDIYEVDVSTRAIYIGPDSDISEVRVQYYDPDSPDNLGIVTADVSVNGPFIGRVDADLTTTIPSTSQPARILAFPVDIVNNDYVRPDASPLRILRIPPIIDVIFALQDLPAIPAVRADRTFRLPGVPYGEDAAEATDLIIPCYGRRLITVQVIAREELDISFYLVALQPGNGVIGFTSNIPVFLGTVNKPASVGMGSTANVVIKASDSVSQVSGATSVPTTYTELSLPLPSVKGMNDLLIINLECPTLGPDIGYADVFIKLSDREV